MVFLFRTALLCVLLTPILSSPAVAQLLDDPKEEWILRRAINSFRLGNYDALINLVAFERIRGNLTEKEFRNEEINFNMWMIENRPQPGSSWLENSFLGAMGALPGMLGGIVDGINGGGVAGLECAGIALLAGQAGPQAATPEEVVTMPGAFSWCMSPGFTFYSNWFWYRQGVGLMYRTLRNNVVKDGTHELKVGHNTAAGLALVFGIPYMVIEKAQVGGLTPGAQALTYIRDLAKQNMIQAAVAVTRIHGTNVAVQTVQEAVQAALTQTSSEIGRYLVGDQTGISSVSGRILMASFQEGFASFGPMMFLALPGGAYKTTVAFAPDGFFNVAFDAVTPDRSAFPNYSQYADILRSWSTDAEPSLTDPPELEAARATWLEDNGATASPFTSPYMSPSLANMETGGGIPTVDITPEQISAGDLLLHLQASLSLTPNQPAQFRVTAIDLEEMTIPLRPFEATLEVANVPYAQVEFHDQNTGKTYRYTINGTQTPPAPSMPTPEAGREIVLPLLTGELNNVMGKINSDVLEEKVRQWPTDVQERFWQLAGLFGARTSEPVMKLGFSGTLSKVLRPEPAHKNVEKIWDLFVEVQQFFEPISPTTAFRRINGTFEQAYEYHHKNPMPKGLARTNPVRVVVPGTQTGILIPQAVRNKLDGWIRLASNDLTTETRGVFSTKPLPNGDLLITDFIPQPGYSESLLRPNGSKSVTSELGTMQTLNLSQVGRNVEGVGIDVLFIFGIHVELQIPIPPNIIKVHSHFLSTPYQDNPSDADHAMRPGIVAAVRTPYGGLIFYGHAPLTEEDKPFSLIIDPMPNIPPR